MADVDYAQLQEQYGGRYVVRRGEEVLASAETYDELRVCESIASRVEFVHRFDTISESLAFEKYRTAPT